MDIKIGFNNNPRELVIASEGTPETVAPVISEALNAGDNRILELKDAKGRTFFIATGDVAYVEVGTANKGHVGFGLGQ